VWLIRLIDDVSVATAIAALRIQASGFLLYLYRIRHRALVISRLVPILPTLVLATSAIVKKDAAVMVLKTDIDKQFLDTNHASPDAAKCARSAAASF
jgi:hypothetical protein